MIISQSGKGTTETLPTGAATELTLAAIKAKTDNLDVLLSTRTKPADSQVVTGPLTNTELRATPVPTTPSPVTSSTGVVTTVAVGTTSTQLLPANANRKGCIITNIGGNTAYVGLGFAPTTSSYSRQINTTFPNDTWEIFVVAFTGAINCVRGSGTSNVLVTELT